MITWVDVLAIIVALGFAVLGFWRGFRREILVTLAGVVLGVVTASLLGPPWSQQFADRLQGDRGVTQATLQLVILLFVLLFVGYGGGIFMPRRKPLLWQRFAGAGIGLFNGLLVIAFSFQYIQEGYLDDGSILQSSPVASALMQGPRWVFLGIVVGVALAVVATNLYRLFRYISRLAAEAPAREVAAEPSAVAPPSPVTVAIPESTPEPVAPVAKAPPPAVEEIPVASDPEPTIPCPNCSEPVPFGASYCPHCGKIIA
jgi:hypothetical protein